MTRSRGGEDRDGTASGPEHDDERPGVRIRVSAVNDAGESPLSDAVEMTVP